MRKRTWAWLAAGALAAAFVASSTLARAPDEAELDNGAERRRVTLAVEGVSCAGCSVSIRKALHELESVRVVEGDSSKEKLVVEYTEGKATPARIVDAVRRAGFTARILG